MANTARLQKQHCLYRHFTADGRLLYVGISVDPFTRWTQHKCSREWIPLVARIELQWFTERWRALEAEQLALRTENPIYNQSRPTPHVPPAIAESAS